ncbi:hypothetical protein DRO32_03010 [Candidatus Bathyarchaeota archaeon]|nr:MAG: hypothetical protein DRO32_03010 [Candidatus Bathyarchaeota archaeon]
MRLVPEGARKVAVVGASERWWRTEEQKEAAKSFIRELLSSFPPGAVLVTGGCPEGGVDVWAEEAADEFGVGKLVFRPEGRGWRHYRARNVLIAENCDVLFVIEPEGRRRSGGLWTARMASRLGKPVIEVRIGPGGKVAVKPWRGRLKRGPAGQPPGRLCERRPGCR